MKHKSPQGPSAHRGGHIWAVPSPVGSAIWGDLGSGSPRGAGPGLGSPPRGALVTPSSLLLLSYCCKYFNEMEKEKKKDKKKRKSHHLKPPGACGPGQPRPCGAERAARPRQPGLLCVRVHPGRGGRASRAAFYNPETDATISKQQRNKEPVSFPPAACHRLSCPPLASVRQPSWGVYLTACPRTRGLSAPPLPTGPGETPSRPKMLSAEMAALPLLRSCFLYFAPGGRGRGRRGPEGQGALGVAGREGSSGAHLPTALHPRSQAPARPRPQSPEYLSAPSPPTLGVASRSPHLPALSTSAPTPPCLLPLPLFSQVP